MSRVQDTANQITMLRSVQGITGTPIKAPPLPREPRRVEADYAKFLRLIVKSMKSATTLILDKHLPVVRESYLSEQRLDNWADDIEEISKITKQSFDSILNIVGVESSVEEYSYMNNAFSQEESQRMIKGAFGVNLFKEEPWLNSQLTSWTKENVSLIKDISTSTSNQIEQTVQRGFQNGLSNAEIKKQILSSELLTKDNSGQTTTTASIFRKTRNRAELIAVDQTGKLNAKLTEERQTDLGIDSYFWRNSQDERVRGNPNGNYPNSEYNHWVREGKLYHYDKDPADGSPGQAIRCRCTAEANLQDLTRMVEQNESKAAKAQEAQQAQGFGFNQQTALRAVAIGATVLASGTTAQLIRNEVLRRAVLKRLIPFPAQNLVPFPQQQLLKRVDEDETR